MDLYSTDTNTPTNTHTVDVCNSKRKLVGESKDWWYLWNLKAFEKPYYDTFAAIGSTLVLHSVTKYSAISMNPFDAAM